MYKSVKYWIVLLLGIVGGRLYQGELQGIESAHIAVRILSGEPLSHFPPKMPIERAWLTPLPGQTAK